MAVGAQALALVLTFGSSMPGVQAIVMTLLCVVFGFVHCALTPLKDPSAQTLQTCLLLCLTVLALASTPFAHALDLQSLSVVSAVGTMPSATFASRWGGMVGGEAAY